MTASTLLHRRIWLGIAALGVALLVYFFLPESCPEPARRVAGIFVIAALFWGFEILPHYGTSILVVLLLIFTLAKPGGILGFQAEDYKFFLIPFSSPVIILFFGGFILAKALRKHKVDHYITENIVLRFGSDPKKVLLGIMLTSGFLSMWISNTATTAIMLGLITNLVQQIKPNDPFRKCLILSIPFSANIGGIGTPIGTPPNIIALGNLAQYHDMLSFAEWMLLCVPLAFLLIGVTYIILLSLFPIKDPALTFTTQTRPNLSNKGKSTLVIFFIVVTLWLTSQFHGIPEALTALLGVALLIGVDLIDRIDINHIDWDVLLLMWGGLALGEGMEVSGLTNWVVSLPIFDTSGYLLAAIFCILGFFLSTFMSNTAAAALLIPIAISIKGEDPIFLTIPIALACSFAMAFPISTPPNALAFAKGYISTKDMLKAGLPISVIALIVMLSGFKFMIGLFQG